MLDPFYTLEKILTALDQNECPCFSIRRVFMMQEYVIKGDSDMALTFEIESIGLMGFV